MHQVQIPQRYAHFATGTWEISFLSNPDYLNWLDSFASTQPIQPQERLVDYVRQRLPSVNQQSSPYSHQPPPVNPPPPSSSSFANFASHAQSPYQSFPSTSGSTRNSMNGTNDVDFSDLIDYSALGDDGESFLDNSFSSSTSHQAGGGQATLNGTNSTYPSYATSPNVSSSSSIYPPFSSYPNTSSSAGPSSGIVYSTISNPHGLSSIPQGSFYGSSTSSVNPSSFFAPQPSNQSTTSTLAMQSQLIQAERNRNQAALQQQLLNRSSSSTPVETVSQPPQPPTATTISPSMMTNPQFASTSSTTSSSSSSQAAARAQPVASTSRASPAVAAPSPPPKKSTSSSSSKSRTTKSTSTTSSSTQRWQKVIPDVRTQLSAPRLQKAPTSAAQRLLSLLSPFNHVDGSSSTLSDWSDGSDIPPEGRKEVLSELLKYAGEEFWRAWVQEGDTGSSTSKSAGVELLSIWFEGASKGFEAKKDKEKLKGKETGAEEAERKRREVEQMTLALVLQVFGKLPVTHRHLGNLVTVAKRVRKISVKGDEGAVKAAATRLYDKWKKVQDEYNSTQQGSSTSTSSTSAKDKKPTLTSKDESSKRKSNGSEDAPAKKAKITTTTQTTTKKIPTSYAPVTATKLDSSMSFKKKENSTMTAMRAALAGVKKADPTVSTTSTTNVAAARAASTAPEEVKLGKNGKPMKSVRWKPDTELEAVRYIKKAIYDDELEGKTGLGLGEGEEAEENFREMEQQEGMSLSMHLDEDEEMEEEIEWYSPIDVVIPDTEDFASLRQEPDSAEARVQTERESNLMEIDEASLNLLDTPTEPPEYAPSVPDPESKAIPFSADLASDPQVLAEISAAQAAAVPLGGFAANDQIESLLGQLNTSILPQPQGQASFGQTATGPDQVDPATLDALKGYDVEQIRLILNSQPAFKGLTVEDLGLAPGGAANYAPPPAAAQAYGHEPPRDPYGRPVYPQTSNYGTAWQPSAPPPPSTHDAYNGYVPPVASSSAYEHVYDGVPLPSQKASLKKGKRNKKGTVCKFFRTNRGCDWGDKCSFIHDNS